MYIYICICIHIYMYIYIYICIIYIIYIVQYVSMSIFIYSYNPLSGTRCVRCSKLRSPSARGTRSRGSSASRPTTRGGTMCTSRYETRTRASPRQTSASRSARSTTSSTPPRRRSRRPDTTARGSPPYRSPNSPLSASPEGVGLYTILPLPILYVEWQNRGGGGNPYVAQY